MRKIRNLIIGGIENKVFNLILITAILIICAFIGMMSYQNKMLATLSAQTNARQQESIGQITNDLMDQVVAQNMDRITELEARITDEIFSALQIGRAHV